MGIIIDQKNVVELKQNWKLNIDYCQEIVFLSSKKFAAQIALNHFSKEYTKAFFSFKVTQMKVIFVVLRIRNYTCKYFLHLFTFTELSISIITCYSHTLSNFSYGSCKINRNRFKMYTMRALTLRVKTLRNMQDFSVI